LGRATPQVTRSVLFFSEFLLTTDEILSLNPYRFRTVRAEFRAATPATTARIE
jgi:hypothetical protein